MPKHVVLSDVCHRLLKMRAAQLGVSMGDAVMAWLHEASVPLGAPVVGARCSASLDVSETRVDYCDLPAGHAGQHDSGAERWKSESADAVKPLVMDVDELRAAVVGMPARPSTTSEPVSGALAEVRAKAFTGPFSKAAQMGKK